MCPCRGNVQCLASGAVAVAVAVAVAAEVAAAVAVFDRRAGQ